MASSSTPLSSFRKTAAKCVAYGMFIMYPVSFLVHGMSVYGAHLSIVEVVRKHPTAMTPNAGTIGTYVALLYVLQLGSCGFVLRSEEKESDVAVGSIVTPIYQLTILIGHDSRGLFDDCVESAHCPLDKDLGGEPPFKYKMRSNIVTTGQSMVHSCIVHPGNYCFPAPLLQRRSLQVQTCQKPPLGHAPSWALPFLPRYNNQHSFDQQSLVRWTFTSASFGVELNILSHAESPVDSLTILPRLWLVDTTGTGKTGTS